MYTFHKTYFYDFFKKNKLKLIEIILFSKKTYFEKKKVTKH